MKIAAPVGVKDWMVKENIPHEQEQGRSLLTLCALLVYVSYKIVKIDSCLRKLLLSIQWQVNNNDTCVQR